MKRIIVTGIFLVAGSLSAYCQDTSKAGNKRLPPETKNYGPYIVTMDNGKITAEKNPDYDASKVLKRDTASSRDNGIVEIYAADTTIPVIKKYLIYDMNSISSDHLMPKEERMTKYNSRTGVLVVHLKSGVVPINENDLLNKFKVSKKNHRLPLYLDYKPIARPDDLLAIPEAVLKIEKVKDADGFQFLNITTKEWDTERKKNTGKDIIYIK